MERCVLESQSVLGPFDSLSLEASVVTSLNFSFLICEVG